MELCLKTIALSKSYNSISIIENWNLEVKQGERLTIIGPSGCGKTTFLRLIAGFEQPSSGKLYLNFKKAGYVFQEPRLIPWKTVKENLLFVRPDGSCQEILAHLGLKGYENYYPIQLSGGMAQRANLARALFIEPDLLLLDEAFFAIDLQIKYTILQYIMDLWEKSNFTLISITHDPKDALLLADKILLVSEKPSKIQESFWVECNHKTKDIGEPQFLQVESDLINKMRLT
jgi:ABC-type nitrate/sulfonate/bicarbonate transport system ATPase subunit